MDITHVAADAKRLPARILNALSDARPGKIAELFGLSQIILGVCFILFFCFNGYPDQDQLDDQRYLPTFLQFILANPAYIGMFCIILGSIFLIGGRILSAVDIVYKRAIQHEVHLIDQINSIKTIVSAPEFRGRAQPNTVVNVTPAPFIDVNDQRTPVDDKSYSANIATKRFHFWPFAR